MATKLFLRNTQNNGIGATYYDLSTSAGSLADTSVTDTVASGTEIQITKTAAGSVVQWISGRAPAGGFTLTSTDISIWAKESNNLANCGGRFRVFKRAANGTETELGGGPFNDGVEFTTSDAEYLWVGNVTDTAFAENDRVLLKVYITNVGTMASGRTCTITFNGADAATGDSFFNLAETVTFKTEDQSVTPDLINNGNTLYAPSFTIFTTPGLINNGYTIRAWDELRVPQNPFTIGSSEIGSDEAIGGQFVASGAQTVSPGLIANGNTLYAPQVNQSFSVGLIANGNTLYTPTLTLFVTPGLISNGNTVYAPTRVNVDSISFGLINNGNTVYEPSIAATTLVSPGVIANGSTLYDPSIGLGVAPGVIANGTSLYQPFIGLGVAPGLITNTPTLYQPTFSVVSLVSPDVIANGNTVFTPLVVGNRVIELPLLMNYPMLHPFSLIHFRDPVAAGTKPRSRGPTRARVGADRSRDRGRDYR